MRELIPKHVELERKNKAANSDLIQALKGHPATLDQFRAAIQIILSF